MLKMMGTKLNVVFLSACHSEGLAEAFLEAGASHVICIKKEDSVLDEACIQFSNSFYDALFIDKKTPCEAFNIANQMISISKGLESQNGLFSMKMIRNHEHSPCELIKFEKGHVKQVPSIYDGKFRLSKTVPSKIDHLCG